MKKQMTIEECKSALFNLGIKLGVSPRLISERLLSKDDKDDMLNGLISLDELSIHCQVWLDNKMPDYATAIQLVISLIFNYLCQGIEGMEKVSSN